MSTASTFVARNSSVESDGNATPTATACPTTLRAGRQEFGHEPTRTTRACDERLPRRCATATTAASRCSSALLLFMIMAALSILVLGLVVSQVDADAVRREEHAHHLRRGGGRRDERSRGSARRPARPTSPARSTATPRSCRARSPGRSTPPAAARRTTVTVQYFKEDPAGQSAAWRACQGDAVHGTAPAPGPALPAYAFITSHGQAASSAQGRHGPGRPRHLDDLPVRDDHARTSRVVASTRAATAAASTQFCLRADGLHRGLDDQVPAAGRRAARPRTRTTSSGSTTRTTRSSWRARR